MRQQSHPLILSDESSRQYALERLTSHFKLEVSGYECTVELGRGFDPTLRQPRTLYFLFKKLDYTHRPNLALCRSLNKPNGSPQLSHCLVKSIQ